MVAKFHDQITICNNGREIKLILHNDDGDGNENGKKKHMHMYQAFSNSS